VQKGIGLLDCDTYLLSIGSILWLNGTLLVVPDEEFG